MKIQEIYDKYTILPMLQLHQYRVAAVATIICDNFADIIDRKSLVSSCLLHDIGKMVMFDMLAFPDAIEPLGLDYWENVKRNLIAKYGDNQHIATNKIVEEIGVDDKVSGLIKLSGFGNATSSQMSASFEIKILTYSDMRVAPYGVTTLDDRLEDGRRRYVARLGNKSGADFDRESASVRLIEKMIFEKCKITPLEITEQKAVPILEDLKKFELL